MKALLLSLALFSLAPKPCAAAPEPAVVETTDFLKSFRELMKINAKEKMAALVKKRSAEAVMEVVRICEDIAKRPSEELERDITALRKAWRDSMKSDFVGIQYEYHSLLRPEFKKERAMLKREVGGLFERYTGALEEKDEDELAVLGPLFEQQARKFEGLGDYYEASQCWLNAAACYAEEFVGERARPRQQCIAYGNAIEARDKVELRDDWYQRAKSKFQDLEYQGFGDPSKGPEARAAAKKEEEATQSFEMPMAFEVFADLEAVGRPLYGADGFYQVWPVLALGEKGSTTKFTFMENSPQVIRTDTSKAFVDTDGDGEGDVEIPLSGTINPVEVELSGGGSWAFLAAVGRNDDVYQGFRYYLSPTEKFMQIYVAPAASLVGAIAETPIRILDDNMDGIFGSGMIETNHFGLVNGIFQRDVDSVLIGEAKSALPWSEVMQIEGAWYRLERSGDGFTVTPTAQKTGKLKLDFKGGKPDFLIVRGTELQANYYFDLTSNPAGVEVPQGTYELLSGRLSKGKRDQMSKALIVPSNDTPSWTVYEGDTVTVELGGPFGMDFDVQQDEESIQVIGSSIVVTGKANERYLRLWNCVLHPEVMVRTLGKKKGKSEEKMRPSESQEDIMAQGNNVATAWFPLDAVVKKKKKDEVEVQLVEKKNKLFGKIESAWRK